MSDVFKSADWAREAEAKKRARDAMLRPHGSPWLKLDVPTDMVVSDEILADMRETAARLQRYSIVERAIVEASGAPAGVLRQPRPE